MKKIIVASSLFMALVLPAFAVSASGSGNQDVTLTIDKAIEATAAGSQAAPAKAPSGSSNVDSTTGLVTAVNLRSNAAWTGKISASATKMAGIGGEGEIPTSQSLLNDLKYSADNSTWKDITTSEAEAKTGSRNGVADGTTGSGNYNNTQAYQLYYRQPVSWGDEAGKYKIQVTHSLSN